MQDWRTAKLNQLEIEENHYDLAFSKNEVLDDRTDATTSLIKNVCISQSSIEYAPENSSTIIDNVNLSYSEMMEYQVDGSRVLVDSTCLRIPELLYLFKTFNRQSIDFDVLYLEPYDYQKDEAPPVAEQSTQKFELSDEGIGVNPIPGFLYPFVDSKLVIALGFEGHRFGFLLESEQFNTVEIEGLIGVPAYKAGWENRTLSNNFEQINQAIEGRDNTNFLIAGANDPYRTYKSIEKTHEVINNFNRMKEGRSRRKNLNLAPFGTKPMSVAMAWYAANHTDVGVIYDFLKKKDKRSHGLETAHIWSFKTD